MSEEMASHVNMFAQDSLNWTNTSDILSRGRFNMTGYPSGYDTWVVVSISIIVVFIMASIIIGNLLVIVAIFSEYSLQCVQNWFVASLAVSDLTLAILVMPFSLAQEVVGYWLFGAFWCQVCTKVHFIVCSACRLYVPCTSFCLDFPFEINFFLISYAFRRSSSLQFVASGERS
jgi:hypothetical protein